MITVSIVIFELKFYSFLMDFFVFSRRKELNLRFLSEEKDERKFCQRYIFVKCICELYLNF
jgi:hypothetical protein